MNASSSLKLALAPGPEAVAKALGWLEAIADQQGWAPATTFGLTLSVDEALTNVLSYAFDGDGGTDDGANEDHPAGSPHIELSCRETDSHIVVELRDNGQPYDPTSRQTPPTAASLDEAEIGGHGLRLMHHYLDRFDYRYEQGWNVLTLGVRRGGAKD